MAALRAWPLARRHRRKARSSWWKARRKNLKQSRRNPRRDRERDRRDKVRLKNRFWSVGRFPFLPRCGVDGIRETDGGELGPKIFLLDSGFFHIIRLVDGLTFDNRLSCADALIDGVCKGGYPVITRYFTSHSRPPRHASTENGPKSEVFSGARRSCKQLYDRPR